MAGERPAMERPPRLGRVGSGAEGVLLCQGSGMGGWSFYVQDGKLHYVHNYVRRARYKVSSPDSLPTGRHQLRFEFEPTGKAEMRMAMARQ